MLTNLNDDNTIDGDLAWNEVTINKWYNRLKASVGNGWTF